MSTEYLSKDTGGEPAFPVPGFEFMDDTDAENPKRLVYQPHGGMTLRDYFAAKALQGVLADPAVRVDGDARKQSIATLAYELADAMLAERAK